MVGEEEVEGEGNAKGGAGVTEVKANEVLAAPS